MKFQQQQQQQHSPQQQQQQLSSGPMSPQQEQLKHLKLQQLQMEQELLKKRQDEIARQVAPCDFSSSFGLELQVLGIIWNTIFFFLVFFFCESVNLNFLGIQTGPISLEYTAVFHRKRHYLSMHCTNQEKCINTEKYQRVY